VPRTLGVIAPASIAASARPQFRLRAGVLPGSRMRLPLTIPVPTAGWAIAVLERFADAAMIALLIAFVAAPGIAASLVRTVHPLQGASPSQAKRTPLIRRDRSYGLDCSLVGRRREG